MVGSFHTAAVGSQGRGIHRRRKESLYMAVAKWSHPRALEL